MKKFAILLCIVVLLCFAACGKPNNQNSAPADSSENSGTGNNNSGGNTGSTGGANDSNDGGSTNSDADAGSGSGSQTGADTTPGILSNFTATDIDGNIIDQNIFKGHKVTMVNLWGTYCGPCKDEMPALAALHAKYAQQGFQVVGIVIDVVDRNMQKVPNRINSAKEIIANTGANYMHIVPTKSVYDAVIADTTSIPTTIFVDENGCQVGNRYIGKRSQAAWENIILSVLAAQ